MGHRVALKAQRRVQQRLAQGNPLSHAARFLLAGQFGENDQYESDRQRIAQAARMAAVGETLQMFIEAADIEEKRLGGRHDLSRQRSILHERPTSGLDDVTFKDQPDKVFSLFLSSDFATALSTDAMPKLSE